MAQDTPKFIVFQDLDGGFRWRLRSATLETLAWSEWVYSERKPCVQEVRRVKAELYPEADILDLTIRR